MTVGIVHHHRNARNVSRRCDSHINSWPVLCSLPLLLSSPSSIRFDRKKSKTIFALRKKCTGGGKAIIEAWRWLNGKCKLYRIVVCQQCYLLMNVSIVSPTVSNCCLSMAFTHALRFPASICVRVHVRHSDSSLSSITFP